MSDKIEAAKRVADQVREYEPMSVEGVSGSLVVLADALFKCEAQRDQLRAALDSLMQCHDEDIGMDHHADQDSVGWYGSGEPIPLTFGVLRRARAILKNTGGQDE